MSTRIFHTYLEWSTGNAERLRAKLKKEFGYKVTTDVYCDSDEYLVSIIFDQDIDQTAFKLKFNTATDLNSWLMTVWDK